MPIVVLLLVLGLLTLMFVILSGAAKTKKTKDTVKNKDE